MDSYRDLIDWQKSMDLVTSVYDLTSTFPPNEQYSLTQQIRRSAVSIPSNIAEGQRRSTRKDFTNFISIAFGSGAELETQIEISKRLKFTDLVEYKKVDELLEEVMKMLNVLRSKLKASSANYSLPTTN